MKTKLTYYFILLLSIGSVLIPGTSTAQAIAAATPAIDTSVKDIVLPPLDSLFVWARSTARTLKGQGCAGRKNHRRPEAYQKDSSGRGQAGLKHSEWKLWQPHRQST
jgi:hypothetical protein